MAVATPRSSIARKDCSKPRVSASHPARWIRTERRTLVEMATRDEHDAARAVRRGFILGQLDSLLRIRFGAVEIRLIPQQRVDEGDVLQDRTSIFPAGNLRQRRRELFTGRGEAAAMEQGEATPLGKAPADSGKHFQPNITPFQTLVITAHGQRLACPRQE